MFSKKSLTIMSILTIVFMLFTLSAYADDSTYAGRFTELYEDIKDPDNGYFSPDEGIPYHSVETLIVEAPDYGHVTTSEAFSYYIWLEAMNGNINGDFSGVEEAWQVMEDWIIPSEEQQPGFQSSTVGASYAPEGDTPSEYPVQFDHQNTGSDPLHDELMSTYNEPMYLMHWLMDVDNWYGYGEGEVATFINTFQRGPEESTWETVPHPSIEEFEYGGPNGFLDLYGGDENYSEQWRFTNAPDAEARAIQALWNAYIWAEDHGKQSELSGLVEKAAKMGDFLRSNMFDKYYKELGAQNPDAPSAGYDSAHYLMAWYTSWGGDVNGQWAFKIGCSHSHFFYQNPMTAWILVNESDFSNNMKASNAVEDWETSLERQLEFYTWLQSSDGAIAGGATNSWKGRYEEYPAGRATFYDMAYVVHPVYEDPGSNEWFGTQAWGMQRVAELHYRTGDEMAKNLMDKWVAWVKTEIEFDDDEGTYQIPATIEWSGQPETWDPSQKLNWDNPDLSAEVIGYGTDVGVTGSLANILLYYAKAEDDDESLQIAKKLLDYAWDNFRDDMGLVSIEERADYSRFFEQEVYVPDGWSGRMANGDVIEPGVTFIDIRSKYKEDPMYDTVLEAWENDEDPEMTYHRFWHQVDYAMALGLMAELFPDEKPDEVDDDNGDGGELLGDVNGDTYLDSMDYVALRRYSTGDNNDIVFDNADMDKDGTITSLDVVRLRRLLTQG